MHHSRTLYVGLDVHKDAIAVAYVVNDHDAEVIDLGTIGTRPCDSDQPVRTLQATAKYLVFVDEAGPCGYWLSRDLTPKGYDCWGVAPSLIPKQAGDRVNTARRDAVPWARLGKRSRQLSARGKHPNQVVVARARALIACMWAIARQVPVTA